MERRVLLAVFLSFLVLYAYQALFVQPPPPDAAKQQQATGAASLTTTKPTTPASASSSPSSPAVVQTVAPAAPQPAAVITDAAERQITVETATVEAVISNRGTSLVSWKLKQYQNERGESLDLVPSNIPPDQPTPFSLRVDDAAITNRLNTAIYRSSGDALGRVDATGDRKSTRLNSSH